MRLLDYGHYYKRNIIYMFSIYIWSNSCNCMFSFGQKYFVLINSIRILDKKPNITAITIRVSEVYYENQKSHSQSRGRGSNSF